MTLDDAIARWGTGSSGSWLLRDGRWLTAPLPHSTVGDPFEFMAGTGAVRWRTTPDPLLSMSYLPSKAQTYELWPLIKRKPIVELILVGTWDGPSIALGDAEDLTTFLEQHRHARFTWMGKQKEPSR